jgi:hypothetical protein
MPQVRRCEKRDATGSESTVPLVEAIDQAADHSGDEFELFLESKRGGVFDELASAADFQV